MSRYGLNDEGQRGYDARQQDRSRFAATPYTESYDYRQGWNQAEEDARRERQREEERKEERAREEEEERRRHEAQLAAQREDDHFEATRDDPQS